MEAKKQIEGLTAEQVAESRVRYGENVLTPPARESLWSQFREKFRDPIILILLVALGLSFAVACFDYLTERQGASVFLEPVGIAFAIGLATGVGFAFEVSANRKFEVLNRVNDEEPVKVIRDGTVREIPRKEVVVGDIVVLEPGEEVPADGRLLEAVSLQVNESTLTGEPMARKTTDPAHFDPDATYPSDRILRGTTVMDGHGLMAVEQVGDATEYGRVYEGAQIENNVQTPLSIQLKRLAGRIARGSYLIALVIVAARTILYFHTVGAFHWLDFGEYFLNTCMIAVTVIVVAVPEGLPMSVTLSLALSMKRMLATNNLVRKLHACETMGAATVICTDKTGTLTENRMRVVRTDFYFRGDREPDASGTICPTDRSDRLMAEGIAVNTTAFLDVSDPEHIKALGNPTEAALLLWLYGQGIDYEPLREQAPVIGQLTFSTERKYMATVVDSPELKERVLYVKGAPEIVFAACDRVLTPEGPVGAEAFREPVEAQLLDYQNRAMRTLGFAYREVSGDDSGFVDGRLAADDLIFLGIVAISDPVRKEVPDAVKSCLDAGIRVKIVTGDTPATAREIARQIGLWTPADGDRNCLTGTEFAAISDEALLDRILDLKILSRARPLDKARLVRLLQQKGEVVAVTGDGTNDAPALNAAQVGLSMGDGTSVAKEASAITILDNSFGSITRAVMWGRSLYRNIQKFVLFQLTINVAACLIVLIGSFLGTESPLTVTQMLWVNLIMDTFAALALASLPPDERVMRDKPRNPSDFIITRKMGTFILGVGLLFVAGMFGLLQYFKHTDSARLSDFSPAVFLADFFNFRNEAELGLSAYELSLFFTFFVLLQCWNMFNAKAFGTHRSAFAGIGRATGFWIVVLLILAGQYLIVTFAGPLFNAVPLRAADWGIMLAVTSAVLWIGELLRFVNRQLTKKSMSGR